MKQVLTPSEREQIAALVAKIEEKTAAELVTAVYTKSASYGAYRVGWSAGFALALVSIAHLLLPNVGAMELIGAEGLAALSTYGMLGVPALLRPLVPRWAKQQAVHDRVRQLFMDLGITETRDRSGILIFLSEFERRVEILGDRGIHQHLGERAWKALVTELVQSIRSGRAAEGLTHVIEKLGVELAAQFPVREGDKNELANEVVTEYRS
jgi:putative membrane protein